MYSKLYILYRCHDEYTTRLLCSLIHVSRCSMQYVALIAIRVSSDFAIGNWRLFTLAIRKCWSYQDQLKIYLTRDLSYQVAWLSVLSGMNFCYQVAIRDCLMLSGWQMTSVLGLSTCVIFFGFLFLFFVFVYLQVWRFSLFIFFVFYFVFVFCFYVAAFH